MSILQMPKRCRSCGVAEATPGSWLQCRLGRCWKCFGALRSDLQYLVDALGIVVILFVVGMAIGWMLVPKNPQTILKGNVKAVEEVNRR